MNSRKLTFKDEVLRLASKIPKGKVTTYKIMAQCLGTKAYRAVGYALKNNPCPVKVPCHRVIRSDGFVGGYLGKTHSKLKIKLLKKEGIPINNERVLNLDKYIYDFNLKD